MHGWVLLLTRRPVILLLSVSTLLHPQEPSAVRGRESGHAPLLAPKQTVESDLATGSVHVYRLPLESGQYLNLTVDPRGGVLSVSLFSPETNAVGTFRCSENVSSLVSFVADASGSYYLEVRPHGEPDVGARYRLRVGEPRVATAEDRQRAAGRRLMAEAEQLRWEWTLESTRKSIEKYEQAIEHWRACDEKKEEARTTLSIGEVCIPLGEPEEALKHFRRALRLSQEVEDRSGEAEALAQMSAVYLQLGDNEKALEQATLALLASRRVGHRRGEALALFNLGDVQYAFGDLPKALERFNQSLQVWRELGDVRGQAETLLNLGYTHSDLSQEQEALESYRGALLRWRFLADRRGQALTLRSLGNLYSKLDEKQEALRLFGQARELFRPMGDRASEAAMLNGMGQIYYDLEEKKTALDYYEQALSLYRSVSYRLGEGKTLVQTGRCKFSLERAAEALVDFERALSVFRSMADQRGEAVVLGEIAKIYASSGDRKRALEQFNLALALRRASGNRRAEAEALNEIGHLYQQSGEREAALDVYQKALALFRSAADKFGEASTLLHVARSLRDQGHIERARAELEGALAISESLRTKVGGRDLRASYSASVHQLRELNVDLLMQLHHDRPGEGFAAAALRESERERARSLLESLTEARLDIRGGVEPALVERERALQSKLNEKADEQMRLAGVGGSEERLPALAREIRDLTAEYEQVQAEIRSRSPRYAALTQPEPLSLTEVQKQLLDENTLLLEYALGEERSYLWTVKAASFSSHELPPRPEIEAAARRLYELATARQPRTGESPREQRARVKLADSEYWREATHLSDILLGPVAGELGAKRLLIVADGALQYVPFAALAVPRRLEDEAPVPLVIDHEVIVLPSASTLALLREGSSVRERSPKSVVVVADPVFESDDPRVGAPAPNRTQGGAAAPGLERALRDVGLTTSGGGVPRLLATRREADAILALVPPGGGLKATDFEASRAVAEGPELARYRIVHFATHGLLNNERPELSGLILSLVDREGLPQSGFLRLHDIYNLSLPVELVVLSACSTALGKEVRGEGLIGLVRGFMYAGAARVVASLWKVDDEATGELMKRFYRHMLVEGLSPAAALRAAQVDLWKQKQWGSPFYWAAFVLQGEYR